MAPTTSKPAPKRKAPSFKPPRPKTAKSTKSTKSTVPPRRRSAPSARTAKTVTSDDDDQDEDDDDGDSDDDEMEEPSHVSPDSDEDEPSASVPANPQDAPPTIPPALLTKLIHHHFQNDKTRIGVEARGLIGKYVETFVREAIARAAFERQTADKGTKGVVGNDFLEVDDLEKLAPQLLLDF